MTLHLSPSCLPHVQSWLAERNHPPSCPAALADIMRQSFASYVETYRRYPFFHAHEVHLIPAIQLRQGDKLDELHLPAMRTPTGDWILGTTSDFEPTDAYHLQRITEETAGILAGMK